MKYLQGHPIEVRKIAIGVITRKMSIHAFWKGRILVTQHPRTLHGLLGYSAVLTSADRVQVSSVARSLPVVASISEQSLSQLNDGDVVQVETDGRMSRLWDISSDDNVVFMTNRCNCNCIMCPQPPGPDLDGSYLKRNMKLLRIVDRRKVSTIAFTGGEPTVVLEDLLVLLKFCVKRFPKARLVMLTNGRRLRDFEVAARIVRESRGRLTYCIPLYSDVDCLHDDVVGAHGGFSDAVRAIHNLARLRQRVELRAVVMRTNYTRLSSLSEFIYRNFPFVSHVAFMGLETRGVAAENIEDVWIDPVDYGANLQSAVEHLHHRDINVSIYNLPLCLLRKAVWGFARDSISTWKKCFLPCCEHCEVRARCAGVFSTSEKHSSRITPIRQ